MVDEIAGECPGNAPNDCADRAEYRSTERSAGRGEKECCHDFSVPNGASSRRVSPSSIQADRIDDDATPARVGSDRAAARALNFQARKPLASAYSHNDAGCSPHTDKHLARTFLSEATLSRIIPHLWYTDNAEEAAAFYASLLPNSRVDGVTVLPADTPSGPAGSVKVVEFTLIGQPFMAISAGPLDAFNHAVSFLIECDDQAEIDRLWAALSQGGKVEQCGWLKDRYGLSWQIAPSILGQMMKDPDRARAKRVAEAMLKMVKFDIAGLQKAYDGR
jgi:predicted 3-demethylubiquinone-9 3-methyltransferase (glyoxalase superfamily)